MALANCPECANRVSDKATACPACGYPLQPGIMPRPGLGLPYYYGYEYKSKATLMGLPLIHISQGFTPEGRLRVARGFIAIGNVAVGVVAIGGAALGIFAIAGVGLGLICLAGIAVGLFAGIGGMAVGYIAVGGLALGIYSIGGLALGTHTIYNDPGMLDFLKSLFR